ncbi:hypothetical protein GCM10027160_28950 [Streptomyces calidiresistens]|uniref:Phage tail protein n=1 Tax=Streptomyces calidiresistens TaxID=1485586 RepID=A0A7W3T076_9ACTN|nr:hypothetical protein [Streptomyces calidiresistens]MBB0228514.1 hypothetical protein [Streptomyces calidiresistens]
MSFQHGKNSYFAIQDSGESLRDLSPYTDNISGLPGAVQLSEVTAFGDEGTRHIPGLENTTFSVNGHFNTTATTGPHAVLSSIRRGENGPYPFSYGPAGQGTGRPELSGEAWCTGYNITGAVADKISFTAEFQVDGTVTVGSFS